MDSFGIEVLKDDQRFNFEIIDYAHNKDDNRCKFEVLKNGKLVASFEPDSKGFMHICKNCGVVDEETLHLIADKLETLLL
ncbi:MAG: hypothetical protein H7Y13_13050 [Sphingobacteriaceae bacterium]|nr:hypothetical protein [Sphingobacteriaceae bacterium]